MRAVAIVFLAVGVAAAEMPKDQKDFAKEVEALTELKKAIEKETNGVKKKEAQDKLVADSWTTLRKIDLVLRDSGIADWTGTCKTSESTFSVRIDGGGMRFELAIEGMPESVRKVFREAKDGDTIRFSLAKNPKHLVHAAKSASGLPAVIRFMVPGTVVKSAEIVK